MLAVETLSPLMTIVNHNKFLAPPLSRNGYGTSRVGGTGGFYHYNPQKVNNITEAEGPFVMLTQQEQTSISDCKYLTNLLFLF